MKKKDKQRKRKDKSNKKSTGTYDREITYIYAKEINKEKK